MCDYKHFSLDDRVTIESNLNSSQSFKAISLLLGKSHTSVAREVKKHITKERKGSYGRNFNDCSNRLSCTRSDICGRRATCAKKLCRFCPKCLSVCPEYSKALCAKLSFAPYVCNGCEDKSKCTLEKSLYKATGANNTATLLLKESRSGVYNGEDDVKRIDGIITPLVKQGQSIHHICANNADELMCSERTIYNYVDSRLLTAKNLDLPRKVRYRPRKKPHSRFKVDKSCRLGRTYQDFLAFKEVHGEFPVVQTDTVEGVKGGKVILTISFTDSLLLLAYIREANTSKSVTDIFQKLSSEIGTELFRKLFPVILTDNGSEFSNPAAIEFDEEGNRRTHVFYCDPYSSYQKGTIENSHEFIRRIIPKGASFDDLEQNEIGCMMSHINSYKRKKLNDKSPYEMFSFFHGEKLLEKLGISFVPSSKIFLKPELLR